jgi:hypothetical protein
MAPPLQNIQDPWKTKHNVKATQHAIKELLKDGTPDWVRFPQDYKQYAKETFAYDKETSDNMVREYQIEDQEQLIDFKARNVNIRSSKELILTLREAGVPCVAIYNGWPGQAGLWAFVPTNHGPDVRYITYIQIPAMIEWDVLRLDEHFLPAGLDYRGWRSVLVELVKKGVMTEERMHEVFGKPTDSIVSRKYRRSLYEFRHRKVHVAPKDGFNQ